MSKKMTSHALYMDYSYCTDYHDVHCPDAKIMNNKLNMVLNVKRESLFTIGGFSVVSSGSALLSSDME